MIDIAAVIPGADLNVSRFDADLMGVGAVISRLGRDSHMHGHNRADLR